MYMTELLAPPTVADPLLLTSISSEKEEFSALYIAHSFNATWLAISLHSTVRSQFWSLKLKTRIKDGSGTKERLQTEVNSKFDLNGRTV